MRKRREFLDIQRLGRRVPTRHFLVVHAARDVGPSRVGITVTRKIGNAVVRNRVKRGVREAFRVERAALGDGLDVVVIARDGSGELSGNAIAAEIRPALQRLAQGRDAAARGPGSRA